MSANTQELKAWTTLRARACRQGMQVFRSDPADGPVTYFSDLHGVARRYVDQAALQARVKDLEEAA